MRPPRRGSSPCSAPSRCLLKWGSGRLGLKSELSMLTGASMMAALVTGPEGHGCQHLPGLLHPARGEDPRWPDPPLRVTVRMHCLLCTSHRRTVSSWEPESSTLPSVDTDRQVTWFLGQADTGIRAPLTCQEDGAAPAPVPTCGL